MLRPQIYFLMLLTGIVLYTMPLKSKLVTTVLRDASHFSQDSSPPVTHLPVQPVSQTHKFPKRRRNLIPHPSITAYIFYSLDRASRYGTTSFAKIRISINRAFFPKKQNDCAILVIKQLPNNPKSKNSKVIGYFEDFLLKQQLKHASLFVMNFYLPGLRLKSIEISFNEIAWLKTYGRSTKAAMHSV